ncbi:uncharacterized protein LOC135346700 isoform X4 [Halichondria panicea]
MLFPFLPFMVESLLPWLPENSVATYAGIVVSAVLFGRICGSYLWGALADYKGRKPTIIGSILLVGLSAFVFGFSVNYGMAIAFRFASGLCNGVIPISKAIVSEVSDDSNQSFGVALLGTAWGLALVVGPAVSAAISDPIGQYNVTVESETVREFLSQFPYSPPCMLTTLLCAVSAVLSLLLLPETLATGKRKQTINKVDRCPNSQINATNTPTTEAADVSNCQIQYGNTEDNCDEHSVQNGEDPEQAGLIEPAIIGKKTRRTGFKQRTKDFGTWFKNYVKRVCVLVLCDRATGLSILVYVLFSSVDVSFNDIYSIWAKTSPHLGGLGLSLNEIGVTLTISGVAIVPSSLILFPLLERKFGLLRLYYLLLVILIPAMMLLPNVHYFYNMKSVLWLLVSSVLIVIQSCLTMIFNCVATFINNSVLFVNLGTVNGIGSSCSSLSRALSALLSGKLFSVSLSATAAGLGYPLDYRLVFLLFGLVFVVCVFVAACLPVSINKQKICHLN